MRETLTGFFSLSCAIWPELLEAPWSGNPKKTCFYMCRGRSISLTFNSLGPCLADDGPVMLMNVVHDASMPRSCTSFLA